MNSYDAVVSRNLVKLLDEEIQRRMDSIANGAPKDYVEYRSLVATIQALQSVKEWLTQVETDLRR